MKRFPLVCFSVLLGSAACNSGGASDGGGDGGLQDICNDAGSALASKACELNVTILDGGPGADAGLNCQQFYIDHVGKQLWLWFDVPPTVAPHSLFEILAGYLPNATTPVQLQINVIDSDQIHSLASGTANATGAPKPIQLLLQIPDGGAGAQYFVEATDASNQHDDVHHPFEICASLFPDPDRNIPGVPTPVTLSAAAGNGLQTGSCLGAPCTGVLTVEGRVDLFSVTIPAINRPILYVNLTAPTTSLAPPVAYLGAFQILDPNGQIVYQNNVANVDLALDLSTAQLVKPGLTYTIQVVGLNPTGGGFGVAGPGDPRLTYALTANVMPDEDQNEPDDTISQAHPVQFTTPGTSQMITGRLAYVGDKDWYEIQIPPTTNNATRLLYKITTTTNGGRYPPILDTVGGTLPNPDRAIELTNAIAGGPAACLDDTNQCPQDPLLTAGSPADLLRTSLCSGGLNSDGGSLCLLSFREEGMSELAGFKNLENFEGIIQIPPTSAQGATFYLDYQSYGGTYCDDLDYTLQLDWEAEGPENSTGYHSTIATAIPYGTLTAGTFPDPPMGMSPPNGVSGVITAGYGYLQNPDYLNGLDLTVETPPYDVRGPSDYDAVPSTTDTYVVDFPASYVSSPGYGATWELSWDLTGGAAGPAEDLLIQVQFCTLVDGILSCDATGPSGPSGLSGAFGYTPGDYDPWWRMVDPAYVTAYIPPIFGLNGNTVLAEPSGCFCFNPAFLAAGKFYITVLGADRTAWTDTGYTLNMGITTYPQSFTLDGGADPNPISCPYTPVFTDGGIGDAGTKIPACEFVQGF